jgi:hypothetical protein
LRVTPTCVAVEEATTGSGFWRASVSEEDAEEDAALIAVIVTLGVAGRAVGGV